jgi:hypothetical protein
MSLTRYGDLKKRDIEAKHRRESRPLAERAARMRQAHRAERDALHTRQGERQGREDLARAKIMGLWDRLSGKRGKVSELNAREATACHNP